MSNLFSSALAVLQRCNEEIAYITVKHKSRLLKSTKRVPPSPNGWSVFGKPAFGHRQWQLFRSHWHGRLKHDRVMVGGLEGDTFVGSSMQAHRGLLTLHWPIRHGTVENWGDMEHIWQHIYNSGKLQSEDHPVLITEAPLAPKSNRATAAQILFETFNVPAAYFAIPAVLALYAAGRTTGLALDVGDGVAHCVPIYQGFAMKTATMRSDLSGSDVTDFFQLLLRKQGVKLMTGAEREIVREIKEKFCFVNPQLANERMGDSNLDLINPQSFKLPDGQRVQLGQAELSRAPELLWRPHIWGSEERAVHQLISDAVARTDIDLRAELYQTIVLSGGSTQLRGFGDRLLAELKCCAPPSTKLRIFAPSNRQSMTWIGGSILAGLSTFKKMWVTANDWEDMPDRIHFYL